MNVKFYMISEKEQKLAFTKIDTNLWKIDIDQYKFLQ